MMCEAARANHDAGSSRL